MKTRSFADLFVGVLAYVSLTGFSVVAVERSAPGAPVLDRRWSLPAKRRAAHSIEDGCRHCKGSGACEACLPSVCRVCRGSGIQPHDGSMVSRLEELWDGVR